jgi:FlaA1/EpsC-like NDP-sugar epimerase
MMEDNPVESILNNVDGTKKLADLAVKFGVKQFVMISTDKAVNPTSVMGCSKRICELYCQSLNQAGISDCQFVTTRFGNVLGSNGSVIPIFREQIRRGGPVMVTHPEINRFFMLIPEACRLVLQAATIGKGGQILVFDMGQPVRILDLAKRMIELSGQRNIQIEFSGLRPGEKLYEEVLNDQETVLPTSHPKIKVARVREVDYAEACRQIEELITMARSYDAEGTVRIMKNIIPEYQTIENNEKISSTVVADPVQPVRECTEKSENREERYGEFRYSSGEGARSASLQHC